MAKDKSNIPVITIKCIRNELLDRITNWVVPTSTIKGHETMVSRPSRGFVSVFPFNFTKSGPMVQILLTCIFHYGCVTTASFIFRILFVDLPWMEHYIWWSWHCCFRDLRRWFQECILVTLYEGWFFGWQKSPIFLETSCPAYVWPLSWGQLHDKIFGIICISYCEKGTQFLKWNLFHVERLL